MKELEQLVYARLIADSGLTTMLGGATHVLHGFERQIPKGGDYLTFQIYSGGPGSLTGDFARSLEIFVQFNIYSKSYATIGNRLRLLFDGYRFDVPTNYTDVGAVRGLYDFEGPDGYDESLEVQSKVLRFRFLVTPKAASPITA
ncbi:MAG: hypothetical protein UMS36scaffold28_17 [Phage 59_13]|nr:MAG: hypothetical protein UMS36scaffold28_17 [Phage 59_13]